MRRQPRSRSVRQWDPHVVVAAEVPPTYLGRCPHPGHVGEECVLPNGNHGGFSGRLNEVEPRDAIDRDAAQPVAVPIGPCDHRYAAPPESTAIGAASCAAPRLQRDADANAVLLAMEFDPSVRRPGRPKRPWLASALQRGVPTRAATKQGEHRLEVGCSVRRVRHGRFIWIARTSAQHDQPTDGCGRHRERYDQRHPPAAMRHRPHSIPLETGFLGQGGAETALLVRRPQS